MGVDAATRRFLDLATSSGQPGLWTLDAKAARALADPMSEASQHAPEEVFRVEDRSIPGPAGSLPIRLYWPEQTAKALPILVYYHGGGFVLCNLDTHDSVCRSLARRSGCLTISVAYRLSPETKLPGAVDDAYAAVAWVSANATQLGGDPGRMAVGGDSAGGNLAAAVALLARDRGGPRIAFQLLIYPATDAGRSPERYPSCREFSDGYFLTRELREWFARNQTDGGTDLSDPRISPLLAGDHSGLPPAYVLTAGFDPLRDEGKAYARALAAAGVPVEYRCYETTIHGFLSLGRFIPAALEAIDECAARLREGLGNATGKLSGEATRRPE